jgi:hypothetical protein
MTKSRRFFSVLVAVLLVLLVVAPGVASAAPVSSVESAPSADSGCWYRVRYGDTLSAIASRYGVSTTWLQQYNGIANRNVIYAGRSLRVPCGSSYYTYYPTYPSYTWYPASRNYYYSSYYGCWGYSYYNSYYGRYIYICTG